MTQNDLTAKFLEAHNRSASWIDEGFDLMLAHLRALPRVTIDWDHTVPEHWVSTYWNGEDGAIMSTDLPLIIAPKSATHHVSKVLDHWDLSLLFVDNFDEQVFRIDADKYLEIFPGGRSDAFDADEFTIRLLWFATIT